MADRRRRRAVLRWVLTAAAVAYAVSDWGDPAKPPIPEPTVEPGAPMALRITGISDADVNPGDAIVVKFDGAEGPEPITARIARQPAEILVREPTSVVVRIPSDAAYGKAGMRLLQGERRSRSWDLHIRPTNHRKLIARVVGGLALFVHGLGLLALGLRGLAGHGVRTLIGRLTRSPIQAAGVGVLVGGLTQLTSSAAAVASSLVEARLLALAPTIAIFVGAQLGASITGALLPIAFARESLLLIAIGVLWTRLSTGKRAHAIAELVLGTGLMLYGIHLLQTSVEPLISDPKLLPYLDHLRGSGVLPMLSCAGTGAALAFVLQGPGPVYVLVIGLAQATGALPTANALAILAGTNLGAALGMALIAWQSGPLARPVAAPHIAFGASATLLALATTPLWAALLDATFGSGTVSEYGHTIVHSNMSLQVALAFALSQLAVVGVWLTVVPTLQARVKRAPRAETAQPVLAPDELVAETERQLGRILERQRLAAEIALAMSCSGDRARAVESEENLVEARRTLERTYARLGEAEQSAEIDGVTRIVVADLQLQRVVEQLAHVAELGVERELRLTADEQARLRDMHAIAIESFDALIEAMGSGAPPDLEAAGGREIRMNQLESEARTTAAAAPRKNESASIRLGIAELIDGYEHVGNHLYRVAKAMVGDQDELI